MPFNSNGLYQRLFSWRRDRDAGIKILAERMDREMDGIVDAFNRLIRGLVAWKGPIRGADGTAASPSYTFEADPDTGLYRADDNTLAVTAGGAERVRADADGVRVRGALAADAMTVDGNAVRHTGIAVVDSFNGRMGAVVPEFHDYNTWHIKNLSQVPGGSAGEALDYLDANKADKKRTEAALAEKADKANTEATLAKKADKTAVNAALAKKADKSAVAAVRTALRKEIAGSDLWQGAARHVSFREPLTWDGKNSDIWLKLE